MKERAEWIHDPHREDFVCSACGGIAPVDCEKQLFYESEYCPNCGAWMNKTDSAFVVDTIIIPEAVMQHFVFPIKEVAITDCQERIISWEGDVIISKEIIPDRKNGKTVAFRKFGGLKPIMPDEVSDKIMKHFMEVE